MPRNNAQNAGTGDETGPAKLLKPGSPDFHEVIPSHFASASKLSRDDSRYNIEWPEVITAIPKPLIKAEVASLPHPFSCRQTFEPRIKSHGTTHIT